MIRVLLVDDEQPARERLRELLRAIPDLEVVEEAADGEEATQKIVELRPELVLLDIQMPGISGLEVVSCLPHPRPKVIFCTAFDQYAVDAFELHAVDYLLKPVNRIRLAHAIERIRQEDPIKAEANLNRVTRAMPLANRRLLARCGDRYRVVPQREIVYFSSEEGLTRLHTRDREYVLDLTLNDLEERLDTAVFFRISRAAIVNLDSIIEVRPLIGGTADLALTTGAALEVSRRRLRDLLERMGGATPEVRPEV
jgi:two-component system LytT family response regulator